MWPTSLVARKCGAEAIVVRHVDDGGSRRRKRACKISSDVTKPGQLSTPRASAIVAAGLNLLRGMVASLGISHASLLLFEPPSSLTLRLMFFALHLLGGNVG